MSVGISYLPLHEEAKKIASEIGKIDVFIGEKLCQTYVAIEYSEPPMTEVTSFYCYQ
ncbi:hypothetical protein K9O30_19115 [Clostridium bowmanii]|uniref:hypothetical protein n=1 Tax=Clostridium bowmanii TaxID=132925 RepID=UPI001C0C50D5|nr:hypothetical protein [Clostridium bowmanii]MBU3191362.1 hypothetical protein [Clostridium bowmanii]MCA1075793.1 hypothetical protein [Clostridium bowmanii]